MSLLVTTTVKRTRIAYGIRTHASILLFLPDWTNIPEVCTGIEPVTHRVNGELFFGKQPETSKSSWTVQHHSHQWNEYYNSAIQKHPTRLVWYYILVFKEHFVWLWTKIQILVRNYFAYKKWLYYSHSYLMLFISLINSTERTSFKITNVLKSVFFCN